MPCINKSNRNIQLRAHWSIERNEERPSFLRLTVCQLRVLFSLSVNMAFFSFVPPKRHSGPFFRGFTERSRGGCISGEPSRLRLLLPRSALRLCRGPPLPASCMSRLSCRQVFMQICPGCLFIILCVRSWNDDLHCLGPAYCLALPSPSSLSLPHPIWSQQALPSLDSLFGGMSRFWFRQGLMPTALSSLVFLNATFVFFCVVTFWAALF